MNAARVTVRGWTLGLRVALAELAAARLRWCLVCGRVGLWGWQPLTPAMPITWVCTDQLRLPCPRRPEPARPGSGPALAPRAGAVRLPCVWAWYSPHPLAAGPSPSSPTRFRAGGSA